MSRHITTSVYGMLCTVVMLRGLRAGIPAELHHDDESCAILRIHAGGLGSVINQILLSMVVLPYSRFYIDDTDSKYRKELEGSAGHAALFHKKLTALQQLWALSEPLKLLTARHVDFVNSLPRPLTAVHVRSGDKALEDRGADRKPYIPHDFAAAASSFPEARGGTCLVYGDDIHANHATAQQLLHSLSCYPIAMGGSSTGYHQPDFDSKALDERCTHLHMFLAELSGMAAADYFIGSMNSNVPRLVALMRVALNGLDRSTARDVFDMEWVAYKKL